MHVHSFDRFEHRHSPIHRLDPRVKVISTVLFIVANVLLPDGAWAGFLLGWLFVLGLNALARFTPGYLLKRSLVALPFALVAFTIMFTLPGQPLLTGAIGPWTFTISDAGLMRFLTIVLRSWLSLQAAILLTATTQFPDLMHALRHLRVPAVLVAIISFMYRYLFVLVDEALRLLRARAARSAQPAGGRAGGGLRWRGRVAGYMAGQLFIRSLERSDRVYNAMLARGYQGQLLTMNPHHMTGRDWLALLAVLLALVLVQLVGRLGS